MRNFRDVGTFVNLIVGESLVPEGRLYRCGTIQRIESPEEIGSPKTIFNLKRSPDPPVLSAEILWFPLANTSEVYETETPGVREWLSDIVRAVEEKACFPALFHCHSGVDRTGVAIGSLLSILGVPKEVIVEEFLLSDGAPGAGRIADALGPLAEPNRYFRRVDLDVVRAKVLGE